MGLIIVKIKQKCGICNKNDVFLQIFHLNLKYDTNVFHKKSDSNKRDFVRFRHAAAKLGIFLRVDLRRLF